MTRDLTWPGVLARALAALVLVYATYNPEGVSYFDWALRPLLGLGPASSEGHVALKFVVGVLLLIAWVVFLQATRRSIGLKGVVLALALVGGIVWLLVDEQVVGVPSGRTIAHIALVAVSMVLAVGLSWSFVTRRLTGQIDTDDVG